MSKSSFFEASIICFGARKSRLKVHLFREGHYNMTKYPNFTRNYLVVSKKDRFRPIFVAFSEYMNFTNLTFGAIQLLAFKILD